MSKLKEIERDYFGNDERAINKHSTRTYEADNGKLYKLDRTCDGIPKFFRAYGPYDKDFAGVLPEIKDFDINDFLAMTWKEAEQKLNAIYKAERIKI
jgi:hypothetical protein